MSTPEFYILLGPRVQRALLALTSENPEIRNPTDLQEEILNLLRNTRSRVDLLLIADPSEITVVKSLFPTRPSRRLRYTAVAFLEKGKETWSLSDHKDYLDLRTGQISPVEFIFIREKAKAFFEHRDEEKYQDWKSRDNSSDQQALITIGRALAYERDPDNLLRSILFLSKKITGADAGSIFITETGPEGPRLRFKHSHTFSKDLAYEEFTLPLSDKSIAGYVANHSKVLNIPDVYRLGSETPYSFNNSFDLVNGYQTRSMIAVPLVSPGGKVLGVLQLINCKEAFRHLEDFSGNEAFEILLETPSDFATKVVPFEPRYETLLEAVAGQAAIAMENNRLFLQIERQFEAFVEASVRAIEARDPSTAGHSFRVAQASELLLRAVSASRKAPWTDLIFSENDFKQLTLACLLHDFGKVYLDFNLFSKAKKLLPEDLRYLELRWELLHRSVELQGEEVEARLTTLADLKLKVRALAEPSARSADMDTDVRNLQNQGEAFTYSYPDGRPLLFLTDGEADNLKISRGSLNTEERKIIQSHVVHSYNFVKNIPWPEEFSRIPELVRMHHEMLDGSGYPQGLKAGQIPLEARIITLADVFDALSAADRPYKKALPIDQVLIILREDAKAGKLDQDLLDLFIDQKIYQTILQGAG